MIAPDFRGAFIAVAIAAGVLAIGAWEGARCLARHVRIEVRR